MNLYEETKFIMKKYNLYANRKLGQNFLIDENVINEIVNASNIKEDDLIIEIGPGLGTLTKRLLDTRARVVCVELDTRMVEILKDRFLLYDNFNLLNDDILKVDLKSIINENKKTGVNNVKVVANLPYYITTPIIMKLLEEKLDIDSITVMIQKEVAERLCATPGEKETGSITYTVHYYTVPEKIFEVPNTSFIPEPEVTSMVIKLNILKNPRILVKNEEVFFKVIKIAFMQKRKTLLNALINGKIFEKRQEAERCLCDLGIDLKIRGEKLTLEQFGKIADYICK